MNVIPLAQRAIWRQFMQIKKMGIRPRNLADFVDRMQASGRYTFRREEAVSALGVSEIALRSAARRLAAKGRICAPRRGFYVIVPVEYSRSGAPAPLCARSPWGGPESDSF